MKFSLVCLMPFLLMGDVVSAQSSLTDICAGTTNLAGCKATFTVPSGYKVLTTRKQFKKANKCKTTKKVTYNCGTKSKPKKCTRNACVPGFDITHKNVPTSIQISYTKLNLCNTVRKYLGTTAGNKFIKSRDGICNCFTKLRTLNSQGKFTSLSAGNFDLANTPILDESRKLQTCATNAGLPFGHSRVSTLNKLKATGWQVASGIDMELASFRAMTAVIHPCRATGVCDSAAIYAVFNNYILATYRIILEPILPVLFRWASSLDLIRKSTGYVLDQTFDVKAAYNGVESTLKNYQDAICSGAEFCGSNRPNIRKFMEDVETVLSLSYKLSQSDDRMEYFGRLVVSLLDSANDLKRTAANIPTASEMVSKIKNNEIKVAKDVFKLMPVVQKMPVTAKTVQAEFAPIKTFVGEYLKDAETPDKIITDMIKIDWDTEHQEEFGDDQWSYYVRNGLIAIQGNINDSLAEAVKTYFWLIRALDSQIKDFTLTNGRWRFETGTVPYKRWSTLNMDVPCTKTTKTKYSKSGLTKWSNSHRVYWKCHFGPHDSEYPQVHVPYVRIYE